MCMVHVYSPLNGCHFFCCTDWIYDGFFFLFQYLCVGVCFFSALNSLQISNFNNQHSLYKRWHIQERKVSRCISYLSNAFFSRQWLGRHPKTTTFRDRFTFDTGLPFFFRVRISLLIECFSSNYIIRCNLWFVDYLMLANTKIFISSLCIVFNCVLLLAPDPF